MDVSKRMRWKLSMLFSFAVETALLLLWDIHLDCGIKHGIVEYIQPVLKNQEIFGLIPARRSPFSISYYIEQEKRKVQILDHLFFQLFSECILFSISNDYK